MPLLIAMFFCFLAGFYLVSKNQLVFSFLTIVFGCMFMYFIISIPLKNEIVNDDFTDDDDGQIFAVFKVNNEYVILNRTLTLPGGEISRMNTHRIPIEAFEGEIVEGIRVELNIIKIGNFKRLRLFKELTSAPKPVYAETGGLTGNC